MRLIIEARLVYDQPILKPIQLGIIERDDEEINNRRDLVDYQRERMKGRRISSASAESVMNHVVNRRMSKRQQMRWSMKGAHCLLQTRVSVGRLLVEQDHRAVKRITRSMLGFKSFWSARIIIAGIETMHMIRKGQLD